MSYQRDLETNAAAFAALETEIEADRKAGALRLQEYRAQQAAGPWSGGTPRYSPAAESRLLDPDEIAFLNTLMRIERR